MNGYNFSNPIRRSLARAREEAARLQHEYVGTEHVLLGLLAYDDTIAADVLRRCNADANAIALTIETTIKRGNPSQKVGPDLPYTSRAKKILEESMEEARERNHSMVGTGHLLLGILREAKGIAAQVLNDAGVTYQTAHQATTEVLNTGIVEEAHASGSSAALRRAAPGKVAAAMIRDALKSGDVLAVFKSHGIDTERLLSDLESAK